MRIRKVRNRKMIMTVAQGLLLLAVLSAMFSTITSLFMTSLMEGNFTADTILDKVHASADEMIEVFHQSSVMIRQTPHEQKFYSYAEQP